jgi:hypothetical protein
MDRACSIPTAKKRIGGAQAEAGRVATGASSRQHWTRAEPVRGVPLGTDGTHCVIATARPLAMVHFDAATRCRTVQTNGAAERTQVTLENFIQFKC